VDTQAAYFLLRLLGPCAPVRFVALPAASLCRLTARAGTSSALPPTKPCWQAKRLELLSEIVPRLERATIMFNRLASGLALEDEIDVAGGQSELTRGIRSKQHQAVALSKTTLVVKS
jgi:hypothetical protein